MPENQTTTKSALVIKEITQLANKQFPNSELYLYGSQARGDATKDSDWDILVLLQRADLPFELEIKLINAFYDLELELDTIISPLIYTKTDWLNKYAITPLFRNIEKEGRRLV